MADFTDDYTIIGAAGDYFNCDSTGGWGTGGNATGLSTNGDRKEGSYSLELTASNSGTSNWYHDLTAGSRFIITDEDLHFWFKYLKGKGANFLVQNNTAVIVRLYFGGTAKYADYYCTESGDLELNFGWQLLSCSGKNMRGGVIGGGHNNGTDWDLEIYRVDLRLNFANSNDAPLGMDCWFSGTKITVTSGTSASPVTPADLQTYCSTGRTAFPTDLVTVKGTLVDCVTSIYIGDTLDGAGHEGYFTMSGVYFYLHGLSDEVYRHFYIEDYSTAIVGEIESGTDNDYAVNGCQLACTDGYGGSFYVHGGSFYVYNATFISVSSIGCTELINADVYDGYLVFCNTSYTEKFLNVTVHDSGSAVFRPLHDCSSIMDNILIHNQYNPIYIDYFDTTIKGVSVKDCTGNVSLHDGNTNYFINCDIDNSYLYNGG